MEASPVASNPFADYKLQLHGAIMELQELGVPCPPPVDLYLDTSVLLHKFRTQCIDAQSVLQLDVYAHLIESVDRKLPVAPPMDVEAELGPALVRGNSETSICNVCFEELAATDSFYPLACGHVYHDHCLRDCVVKGRKRTCPLDRKLLARPQMELPNSELVPNSIQ
jgi:hypothetical protein